jgi:hypothetical protein
MFKLPKIFATMRKANLPLKLIKSNSFLSGVESKYKIINVKHHRRMKRSEDVGGDSQVDSTINIRIGDAKGEFKALGK